MRTILEMLAGGEFVSGETMSRELGVSRAAVWKRIRALQEEGWVIESVNKRGYRLQAGDSLDPAFWRGALRTVRLGHGTTEILREVGSTNTRLKQMAAAGAPDGSLCAAERQTAGRGRLGRTWVSPEGRGLWLSVLLRPQLPPEQAPFITFCAAMAMQDALKEACGLDTFIKWPNDIVSGGKKICGILLEMSAEPDRIEYVVAGTGLNVRRGSYPDDLSDRASCVEELTGNVPLRRNILAAYLTALESHVDRLVQEGSAPILNLLNGRCCTIGSAVHVSGNVEFTGVAERIDESGALIVRTEKGEACRVLAGDVSVRGVMGYV